jgi:hypothetical protein
MKAIRHSLARLLLHARLAGHLELSSLVVTKKLPATRPAGE